MLLNGFIWLHMVLSWMQRQRAFSIFLVVVIDGTRINGFMHSYVDTWKAVDPRNSMRVRRY